MRADKSLKCKYIIEVVLIIRVSYACLVMDFMMSVLESTAMQMFGKFLLNYLITFL